MYTQSWDRLYDSVCGGDLAVDEFDNEFSPQTAKKQDDKGKDISIEKIKLHLAVQNLIRSYQTRGHFLAKTDPLGLSLAAIKQVKVKLGDKALESEVVARELGTSLRAYLEFLSCDQM
ncbi:hypothetical protein EVAR_82233_1 [Eumeta japonica]|uniref:Uncharacterized protein n=1 Tax=Eumeta variegata TaxID=151549 RepID=A0A4C1VYD3_EUMVA|nr:hypothetical protein EVAR_82233_1 [Eumeta japonica]